MSGTALARLQGDLVNDGTLEVFNRAAFLAGNVPSTLTNNGSIELAAGSATDTEQTITNATGGSIAAAGDGTIVVTKGVFNQGQGTTAGMSR